MNKESCLWCRSEKPKSKRGWVDYKLSNDEVLHFCSKKCLAAASLDGKCKILDVKKISAKHSKLRSQARRKILNDRLSVLKAKPKLESEDIVELFGCLNAAQIKILALVGLYYTAGFCCYEPEKILREITRLQKGGVDA